MPSRERWTMQLRVEGSILLAKPSKHHPAHFKCTCFLVFPYSHPPEGFTCSLRCLGRQWGKARSYPTSLFISASGLLLQGQLCCYVFPHLAFCVHPCPSLQVFSTALLGIFCIFDTAVGKGETASEIVNKESCVWATLRSLWRRELLNVLLVVLALFDWDVQWQWMHLGWGSAVSQVPGDIV